MKNKMLLSLTPLALLALTRGQDPNAPPMPPMPAPPVVMKEDLTMYTPLVKADNGLGIALLQTLAKHDSKSNIVISPISLASALQMTYNGANGDTAAQMAKALQITGMPLDKVNQGNSALLQTLAAPDDNVSLKIANSLWTRSTLLPLADFSQRNQLYYGATLGDLSGGATAINQWVSGQTNNKITAIVSPDDVQDAEAVLANAVYFKGPWQTSFKPAATTTEKFTLADGPSSDVPMMRQSGKYHYYEDANYQAVSLPYGRGRLEMTVLLPRPGVKFSTFIGSLTVPMFTPQTTSRSGEIGLPRFKTEYGAEMRSPLTALGMGIAFDGGQADFSKMFSGGRFFIGFVKHKTYLDVNEAGTEAAAATAVGVTRMAMPVPQNPFTMVVNRPFVFAIRDSQSGLLLFTGAIAHITG